MRLHHLTISAFGPFAGTVEVDVDALSDAGLFLLTGATGAGKSSVLDAVCFALYGEVPGDRHDAKHLRSDHAAPDALPEVRLDFSVGERRFLFTRSPAWDRPKRRGPGTSRQQARVVVEEHRDGTWTTLTTRLDDAGLLVTDLLGMTCTQFTQVAMLPQGRFQAFLRASSSERHAVLQRLFRTDRFERIERWLADRRRELRHREREHHDRVVTLAHRFSEAATAPLPDSWTQPDPAAHDDLALGGWMDAALEAARETLTSAEVSATAAHDVQQSAAQAHRRALDLAHLQAQGGQARAALAELDEGREELRDEKDRVAAHHRAAAICDRIQRVDAARVEVELLTRKLAEALDFPGAPNPSGEAITAALDAALRAEQQAQADLRLEEEHRQAARQVAEITSALAVQSAAIAQDEQAHAALDTEVGACTTEVASCEAAAAELGTLRVAHQIATTGSRAAADLVEAEAVLIRVEVELRQCVDEALRLREAHLDAREARIGAMAGELAGQLASGCACPVCGSIDHPAPASGAADLGRRHEEDTLRAWETAEATRLAADQALLAARARHDKAAEAAQGRSRDDWARELDDIGGRLALATAAAERLPALRTRLENLRVHRDTLAQELAGRRSSHDHHAATLVEAEARLTSAAGARDAALGDFPDLTRRADHHRERVATLQRARTSSTSLGLARSVLEEAEAAAAKALEQAGFATSDTASAALLDPDELAAAERAIAEQQRARRDAEALLASPEVQQALALAPAEVDAATAALEAAEVARSRADTTLASARLGATRLAELTAETRRAIESWRPAREAFAVAEALSTLAEGTSRDNTLKMRLSAYVLGERLRQVVDAANDRLAVMTDQRYALEHTEERGVGAQKGGLSLRVRDDWTGVRRDPATLSGGETFVVSLALALGLADTVAHEAGGVAIETMFIDEGFGSLDAETLDGVMDTLDSLRHNGRVIGVVSHVAELRERIPVGIEVEKARKGSRLRSR